MMKQPRATTLLLLLLFGLLARVATAEVSQTVAPIDDGSVKPTGIRSQDSLWMISTRNLNCPDPKSQVSPGFRFLRYSGEANWQEADAEHFFEDQRDLTVFFVHGNRIERPEVGKRASEAYAALTRGQSDPASIRFVAWSWPSDRICGLRADVRAKAARANGESYYLAKLLNQLPADTRLGLFGFSYGARIISGALHLQGGGDLFGYSLGDTAPAEPINARVVMLAAAMPRQWWLPESTHSQCPVVADALLVQYNPCDSVLKWYPRMDRSRRPQALGYTGFPWVDQLSENAGKLEQQNASCQIGRTHSPNAYFDSTKLMSRAQEYLLWHPID